MSAVFYILLGWISTVLSAWGWGYVPLRVFPLRAAGNVAALYRFLLGAAFLSLIFFVLSMARLVYKGSIYGVLVLGVALLCWKRPEGIELKWRRSAWLWVGFGLYYFLHALMPEMSPDGMSYHLGLVGRYYREHGFVPFGTNMYAALSQGVEMLFLPAFGIGRHSAAALVHFTFLMLVPLWMAAHAKEKGWWAGLFVFLVPLVGIDGTSAYNDVALLLVGVAVVDAMLRWKDSNDGTWVGVAAFLVGFAFSIKYTGVVLCLLLLPAWRVWPRWTWALACSVPWLAKNFAFHGNPLAPFFNLWFPNPHFNSEFENAYRQFLSHYDLSGVREWFVEVLFGGPKLSGFLGPAGLLFSLGFWARGDRRAVWWTSAALVWLSIYPMNVGTRFLLPALPFLALGLMTVLEKKARWVLTLAVISCWPTAIGKYSSPHTWKFDSLSVPAMLRWESEESFLVRKRAGYVTARTIETFVPLQESVFALSPVAESYTSRNVIVAYQSTQGLRLHHALASPTYAGYQAKARYVCPTNSIRLARDTKDTWSISEIEPKPKSVACRKMPWDVGLLQDGNFASRWRSWGPVRKGDSCELEGEGPWTLWATADQWDVELEGCTREMRDAQADYRQDARRYFLSQGVRFLAMDAPDYGSADMKANSEAWGLELVAERGTMRLYRWKEGN